MKIKLGNRKEVCRRYYLRHKKECLERQRAYRKKNMQKYRNYAIKYYYNDIYNMRERSREYWQKNREERKKYSRKHYWDHKERISKRAKNYRLKNLDRLKKMVNDYHKNNPHVVKGIRQRRRARKNNVIHSFTSQEWKDKLEKTQGRCPSCWQFVNIDKLTMDHIIPLSKAPQGFEYTIDDIRPMCHSCNSGKGSKVINLEN